MKEVIENGLSEVPGIRASFETGIMAISNGIPSMLKRIERAKRNSRRICTIITVKQFR